MTSRQGKWIVAIVATAGLVAATALGAGGSRVAATEAASPAEVGEARRGALTVGIAPAVSDVAVSQSRVPGRPIVVIDPGHGGRDPGARSVSGEVAEKDLTLLLALELRERLVKRGRVRVALTRENDATLTLEQRAGIARRLGAAMFLSLHMDSAPNPLARGASVYSLSDVASDAEAARFAGVENAGAGLPGEAGAVRSMLADLSLRGRMAASAELATRIVRKSAGRVPLRPEPHRFAAFHVLRRAETTAALFEAGYLSNVDDEALLRSPEQRARTVTALAETIETEVAARNHR
jgi:N-acetylmuramoyl-L-alanine amidase